MKEFYNTIEEKSTGIYKEKGSKFIAIAVPVSSVDGAMDMLSAIRKEYHDARHHCYAYRIGFEGEEYRINDDGEPSGTAGKPIYGQLLSFDLTNILVVVVRYFGGTKLGVSGLIRAYKSATLDALQQATIKKKTIVDVYELLFPYDMMNTVMKSIKDEQLDVRERDFNLDCKMVLSVKKSQSESFRKKIENTKKLKIKYLRTE